ncbi:MAG: insulinase family protein [Phycisphaeraceae bacterium]|nr:insulinase family protein [Phycisphaeraceae bacterium]
MPADTHRTTADHITVRTLRCGMPIIIEPMSGVRSASLTWLLPAGSAFDEPVFLGESAMWAELVLRGAGPLDSRAQADAFDRLGASRSADVGLFTMRIASLSLGEKLLSTLPLIADMALRPTFDPEAIEPARDLCLQAIESLQDDPAERAAILARELHFPVPFNRSGLGTPDGLGALTRDRLIEGWRRCARPVGSVLALAGALPSADTLVDTLDQLLDGWSGENADPSPAGAPRRGSAHVDDPTNQVQILIAHDAPPEPHPDSILEKIVVSVLSGGMSGRLFTEVREKRGLCYAVSAGYRPDKDFGTITASVGTTPEKAQESLDVLWEQLCRVNTPEGRITPEEFQRAVAGMKSGVVFSGESTGARSGALAVDYRRLGRPRSLAEITRAIDAVTLDAVNAYLARRPLGTPTVVTLGPRALKSPA